MTSPVDLQAARDWLKRNASTGRQWDALGGGERTEAFEAVAELIAAAMAEHADRTAFLEAALDVSLAQTKTTLDQLRGCLDLNRRMRAAQPASELQPNGGER